MSLAGDGFLESLARRLDNYQSARLFRLRVDRSFWKKVLGTSGPTTVYREPGCVECVLPCIHFGSFGKKSVLA